MAFGTSQASNIFYAKLKGLKKDSEENLHFSVVKASDKENPIEATFISGYFESIQQEEYEYEGEEKKGYKLTIKDGDETYVRSTGMTGVSRSCLNSLLNIEGGIKDLKLSVYVNKSGYNSIYVEHSGEAIGWKHDYTRQKSKIESTTAKSGKVTNDYFELDVALREMIPSIVKNEENDLLNVIEDNKDDVQVDSSTPQGDAMRAEHKAKVETENPEDIPF